MSGIYQFPAASGSVIKSIQRGISSFASGATTQNITVSAVVTGKSTLNFLGTYPQFAVALAEHLVMYCSLTSTTNIAFVRPATYTDVQYLSWELVEYN